MLFYLTEPYLFDIYHMEKIYHVYIIKSCGTDVPTYKIGFTTREVEKRVKEFKTGNHQDLKIEYVYSSVYGTKIEKYLHNTLNSKNIKGEWFELTNSELSDIKEMFAKLDENFKFLDKNNTYLKR